MTDTTPSTVPSTPSALANIPFHGDTLEATRAHDGRVWVSVSRVCEALGLGYSSQLQKLKEKPWATVTLIVMVAADGKSRETACLDLDSLPMWLATIDVRRVRGAAREKLVVYQKEAARVLRDYFLGERPEPVPPPGSGVRVANEQALLALFLGADAARGDFHPGNAVRFAMGVHPDSDGVPVAVTVLSHTAAELALVREALAAIDRG